MKYLNIKKALAAWQNLQPLSEKDRERLSRRFTVDFNYNSNHIEGNTLTYGQTEILLLFGKVIGEADVCDVQEMTASNVGLRMMTEEAILKGMPLTQNFIRTLHKTILREDYTVYRNLPGGMQTSYVIHAGQYKTRPNSVITRYGDRFEYASPEETPGLMGDLVDWYNATEQEGKLLISLLEEQKTWHEGVNSSIVLKHESELIRLRAEIKQAEDLIRKVDAEIDLLQAIYDRMNR